MGDHTIAELAALSGLSVRTIRFYRAQGLIPSAGREGPASRYPASTLARLRLIAKLRDHHMPLAEIRRQLATLPDEAVSELATGPAVAQEPPGSALDYVRAVLGEDAPAMSDKRPPALRAWSDADPDADDSDALEVSSVLGRSLARRDVALLQAMSSEWRGPDELRATGEAAATPPPSAVSVAGERSQWERIVLGPDLELHVRRPLGRRQNRMVERLIAFARQLQGEDKP